jgi:hypothetical protein
MNRPKPRRPPVSVTLVAVLAIAACTGRGAAPDPTPGKTAEPQQTASATWPVAPESLVPASGGLSRNTLTCGSTRTFAASALAAATGADRATGPEYDALRVGIGQYGSQFAAEPGSWRVAARDARGVTFLAPSTAIGGPGWLVAEVEHDGATWQPAGFGQCQLRVVPGSGFGPAAWALDPAYPKPSPDSTQLHVLVWEIACSSGSPTTGRMSPALIEYTPSSVTMTLGVRGLDGARRCPLPPGTPAIVTLDEPLGGRTLLDGGREPPGPPERP